jgi:alginate O-acetyltransferase complex protein AlgI
MLFNSLEFIFGFLPIMFFIYFVLNKFRLFLASKILLVIGSLFFYSWWNIKYLPLILISMVFNFLIGRYLTRNSAYRKLVLVLGIVVNVALLGYYKYFDFFIFNINIFLENDFPLLKLALPLAISFFTFQQIAYLVDAYRHETKEYKFLDYCLFVTFFPQLIAGPIVHHKEVMPQFKSLRTKFFNYKNVSLGLFMFFLGLFKKAVIADTFAVWANEGFNTQKDLSFIDAWVTSLSYTLQLYFDFSGYTDMAIGAALLFNIKLPVNFNSPYKALDIQDFWRRWHITLSRFLTHYIYIPLGGNRKGTRRTYINIFLVFLISGVWHGAGWTFIIWGIMHGLASMINRYWKNFNIKMNRLLAWFITFNFVNLAWVFFRATSISDAFRVLRGMFGFNGFIWFDFSAFYFWEKFVLSNIVEASIMVIVFLFVVALLKNTNELLNTFQPNLLHILFLSFNVVITLLTLISVHLGGSKSEFLYFNF